MEALLPALVIERSVFQSYRAFIPRKVGLLVIATEGILFQNYQTPTYETWTTGTDAIMTSSYLKNSFPALKNWTITAIKSNSKLRY